MLVWFTYGDLFQDISSSSLASASGLLAFLDMISSSSLADLIQVAEYTVSSVPAGGGTVRLYHTTQTAGQRHNNCRWIMVGVQFLMIFGTVVMIDITAKKMLHALETYQETNLTNSLSNINIRNFSKVQNH